MNRFFASCFVLIAFVACGKVDDSTSKANDPATQAPTQGQGQGQEEEGAADVGARCCPRSFEQAGCMNLGGSKAKTGGCFTSCDFFCSTNWRVEKDDDGCDVWRYDVRAPEQDETSSCFPKRDD